MSSLKHSYVKNITSSTLLYEIVILIVVLFFATVIFWFTDIDVVASSFFYMPWQASEAWASGSQTFWMAIYNSVTWVVLLWIALCVFGLSVAFFKGRRDLQRIFLCAMLCLALGPGLLINVALKEHWGRPRPKQIVEFGGKATYAPPGLLQFDQEGKSFPCGHASVGFAFFVFYLIFRQKNNGIAILCLFFSLLYGFLLGYARMAQGGHFLSDVLWSWFLSWLIAYLAYFIAFVAWKQHAETNLPLKDSM